jgi:hypothetical protein
MQFAPAQFDALIAILNRLPYKAHWSACRDDGELVINFLNGRDRMEASLHPDAHIVWVLDVDDKIVLGKDTTDVEEFLAAVREFMVGKEPMPGAVTA